MAHIIVIFNKPVILPGDELEKIKTYGLLLEKTERATSDRISDYIKNYILPVAQLYKEGIEHIDEWSYKKNGEVFYTNGLLWDEYIRKTKKKKIRFAVFDDESKIKHEDLYDDYLFLNKDKWEEMKAQKEIEWY